MMSGILSARLTVVLHFAAARNNSCWLIAVSVPLSSSASGISDVKQITGIDDPYEAPSRPDLMLDTEAREPEESAAIVLAKLEELGVIPAQVAS